MRGIAQVQELLIPFLAEIDAVPAWMNTFAEGTYERAIRLEHRDRVDRRLTAVTLLFDVNESLAIDANSVRGLPDPTIRQLAPIVVTLIGVFARTDDGLLVAGLVVGSKNIRACARECGGSANGRRRLFQEVATLHGNPPEVTDLVARF